MFSMGSKFLIVPFYSSKIESFISNALKIGVLLRIGHVKNNDALQISDNDWIFIIKGRRGRCYNHVVFHFNITIPCHGMDCKWF